MPDAGRINRGAAHLASRISHLAPNLAETFRIRPAARAEGVARNHAAASTTASGRERTSRERRCACRDAP
ncbi:hypothetical protein C7S16_0545 [Burkholderia thailandensis]|uniref:Uncharacterized protein n=1 Tax=Burkholderia thailandensis TaxID=57975 RepID=A0AAW9D629_BURTH|nr:hypothetical protein [Burkholderia thailandensis]MDW9257339.1 hypothetical protein [Burkholderia thailandensis]